MNINGLLPKLLTKASSQEKDAILFNFSFETLEVRGVFFPRSKTLTVAIQKVNVGWQIDVSSGMLTNKIPNEVYKKISSALKCEAGKYSNRPFFEKMKSALEQLTESAKLLSPSEDEIMELVRSCKTEDKKYDLEGDKPFFDHWRRVPPSNKSLCKIQRYFGAEVKDVCDKNMVTAVWSAEPQKCSLQFLFPQKAKQEVKSARS